MKLFSNGDATDLIDTLAACLIGLSVWAALLVGIGAGA